MCVLGIVYVLQEVAAVQLLLGKKLSFLPCTFMLTHEHELTNRSSEIFRHILASTLR